jgi:hypothetical protein
MTLREQVHHSIDALDNQALVLVYEQLKLLNPPSPTVEKSSSNVPTLEEVLALTASDKGDWASDIIAAREDRV